MISHMRSILWAGWTVVVFGSVSCDGDMHHDMAGTWPATRGMPDTSTTKSWRRIPG